MVVVLSWNGRLSIGWIWLISQNRLNGGITISLLSPHENKEQRQMFYLFCMYTNIYILLFAALPLFTLCETLYLGISMRSYCESTIPLMNSTLFHSKRIWSSAYASEEGKMPAQPTDHRGKATLINPFDQRFSDRRFGKYKSQRKIQTYSCQTKEDMIGDPWESFLVSWDILL